MFCHGLSQEKFLILGYPILRIYVRIFFEKRGFPSDVFGISGNLVAVAAVPLSQAIIFAHQPAVFSAMLISLLPSQSLLSLAAHWSIPNMAACSVVKTLRNYQACLHPMQVKRNYPACLQPMPRLHRLTARKPRKRQKKMKVHYETVNEEAESSSEDA